MEINGKIDFSTKCKFLTVLVYGTEVSKAQNETSKLGHQYLSFHPRESRA